MTEAKVKVEVKVRSVQNKKRMPDEVKPNRLTVSVRNIAKPKVKVKMTGAIQAAAEVTFPKVNSRMRSTKVKRSKIEVEPSLNMFNRDQGIFLFLLCLHNQICHGAKIHSSAQGT